MRSDYALYVVAVIFFAITGISFALTMSEFERYLSVVATTILGLLFAGIGYTMKTKAKAISTETTFAPPLRVETETAEQEETQPISETTLATVDLTSVKGIKEKRMNQLKALGINNIEDLANASSTDLAAKLKISPKFTEKWIENAKDLTSKT